MPDPSMSPMVMELARLLAQTEVGGRKGRFNLNVPPDVDDATPAPRFAFDITEGPDKGGRWMFQLLKELQGGRWEDAHHAPEDFERYKSMSSEDRLALMQKMWGNSGIGERVHGAATQDVDFDELVNLLKTFNTHRQVSFGEPE